jgi:uncharacterized protein YecT (DUF1311 family)
MSLVVLLGMTAVARAASFDCKLAKTPQEKAICASAELGKVDEELAAAYKAGLVGLSAASAREVREDEADWLRWLGMVCDAGKAQTSGELAKCMVGEYRGREEFLEKVKVRRGDMLFVMRTRSLAARDTAEDGHGFDHVGWGTLLASWPEAESDAPEWVAWNEAVELETETVAGAEKAKPGVWDPGWAEGQDATVDATLGRIGEGRVSVRIENGTMGHGAAHPSEEGENFHWLLKEQREMKVGDVFQAGSGWQKVVIARCERELKKQLGADYSYIDPMAKAIADVIKTPHNWELEAKGLVVSFPEYTVTPRVDPADDVTVPWLELQPMLAATFVRPK